MFYRNESTDDGGRVARVSFWQYIIPVIPRLLSGLHAIGKRYTPVVVPDTLALGRSLLRVMDMSSMTYQRLTSMSCLWKLSESTFLQICLPLNLSWLRLAQSGSLPLL